jgi:hypothetical protein
VNVPPAEIGLPGGLNMRLMLEGVSGAPKAGLTPGTVGAPAVIELFAAAVAVSPFTSADSLIWASAAPAAEVALSPGTAPTVG